MKYEQVIKNEEINGDRNPAIDSDGNTNFFHKEAKIKLPKSLWMEDASTILKKLSSPSFSIIHFVCIPPNPYKHVEEPN